MNETTPVAPDEGATIARVVEFNTLLATKSENELTDLELQQFPFLVCQWRGMHYFTNYLTTSSAASMCAAATFTA